MKLAPDVLKAVQEAALDVGLPISIVAGIVCQESSGWTNRKPRYEPGFFQRYILKIPGLGTEERKGRATSWGPMQVMGQTAREMGYTAPFQNMLVLEIGLYWGCRYLKRLKARYFDEYGWEGVIAAFNAGSPRKRNGRYVNQPYVDGVMWHAGQAAGGKGKP